MALTQALVLGALVAANLGIIWFLLAAPAGVRTTRVARIIPAKPEQIWAALHPLGANALWDGSYRSVTELAGNRAELEINWDGRDGKPIRRTVELFDEIKGKRYSLRIVDDSSLDHSFWVNHCEHLELEDVGDGTRVTVTETDHYKGFAFFWFRYFKNRRMLKALEHWARTGTYKSMAMFEKLPVQIGLGVVSALILWPFFGLSKAGLALSFLLTAIVALHEVGHMFAFHVMGHKRARMIFIPLLGGIALGGRPYDRHYEVAFSALMGAGFSAFPVVAAIFLYDLFTVSGHPLAASVAGGFATIGAIFNLANLVPMWKFDGGQVIRQVFETRMGQGIAAFILLGALLGACALAGFPPLALVIVGTVFAVLSLATQGSGFKPKAALHPMSAGEKLLILAGLIATFTVHAGGTVWGLTTYL